MFGWQLQAMLLKTARQTFQRSTACAVFGDMPYLIWYRMSLKTAQAVLR